MCKSNQTDSRNPPRQLFIVASLWVMTGTATIVSIIASAVSGHVSIDFNLIALPIGYGLLMGSSGTRIVAIALSAISLVFVAGSALLFVVLRMTGNEWLHFSDGGYDGYSFILIAILLAGCLYTIAILTRPASVEWFRNKPVQSEGAKSLFWAITIVSVCLLIPMHLQQWRFEKRMREVYPIHARIIPCDAETGEGLKSLSCTSAAPTSQVHREARFETRLSVIYAFDQGNIEIEANGIAAEPTEIILQSDGYEEKRVTLDRDTGRQMRVRMTKLSTETTAKTGRLLP